LEKILTFNVKKFKFTPTDNKQFISADFWAIRDSLNRNESSFTVESLEDAKQTVVNKPILANFTQNDFGSHDSFPKYDPISGKMYEQFIEKPIGIINESSDIRIEKVDGHSWLCFSGLVWTEYNFLAVNLLKKRRTNKISVEIKVLSSYLDENNIEIIEKFELLGVTLLGDSVTEGIPNAHLSIMEFSNSQAFSEYRKALCFAYGANDIVDKKEFIAKEKIGSKPALKVDTSKDAMSTSPWGKENKAKLKKECLMASNYASVCPSVFLKLGENWKDGIEGSLQYPVMEKKGNTLVYNRYGIASAEAYATKNSETEVLSKIKKIKKKLGLDDDSKKEGLNKMAKKINSVKEEYLSFGQNEKYAFFVKKAENKIYALPFSEKEEECFEEEKLMEMEIKAEMDSEQVDMEEVMCKFVEDPDDDSDDKTKEYEEKLSKLEEEKKEMAEKLEKLEAEKTEMEEKFAEANKNAEEKAEKLEAEKKEMAEKLEAGKKEVQDIRMAEFNKNFSELISEEEDMEEDFKLKLESSKNEGKFSDIEDVKKEIAYEKYKKEEEIRMSKKASFKVNIVTSKPSGTKNLFDEISDSVKKCK